MASINTTAEFFPKLHAHVGTDILTPFAGITRLIVASCGTFWNLTRQRLSYQGEIMFTLQADRLVPAEPNKTVSVIDPEFHVPFHPAYNGRFWRSVALVSTLIISAALPVLSITLCVFGVLSMTTAAIFLVIPTHILAAVLMAQRSPEGRWASRGFVAGLVGVTAYDAVRIPLVITNIWPDFIPRMGGWVVGNGHSNLIVGYLWRYIGDGGGIGLAYFVFCGALLSLRPTLVTRHPITLSIGYGIFVWGGLIFTVGVAPQGQEMLFALTPASVLLSLLGHLIYGSVLGLYLRRDTQRVVRTKQNSAPAKASRHQPQPISDDLRAATGHGDSIQFG